MSREDQIAALWAEQMRALAESERHGAPEPPLVPSADVLRSRRPSAVRGKTTSLRGLQRTVSTREAEPEAPRPHTRGECRQGERPCPYAGCRHHLYLETGDHGTLRVVRPDLELWELDETCALDIAERWADPRTWIGEGASLEEIGALLNVTRERVRQIEERANETLMRRLRALGVGEDRRRIARRLPVLEEDDLDDGEEDDEGRGR